MEFGLKELKQLRYSLLEIAEVNNISIYDASSKFLKDLEDQYDTKLGFESKVKEKREELDKLNNQINFDRRMLQATPFIGPALSDLFKKGVSEQDIIDINQLVEICTSDTRFNNLDINPNFENTHDTDNSKDNKILSKTDYLKSLIIDGKRYGNVKVAIKELRKNHDKLQKQVNDLNYQKQEISTCLHMAISIANTINNRISYFKGFMDHFNHDFNKIHSSSGFSNPFIFIVYINTEKNGGDNNETK